MFIIGSPRCGPFSSWQALNEQICVDGRLERDRVRALVHLRFMCEIYQAQVLAGRYFLHEHPVAASSWFEPCVARVLRMNGVGRLNGDQCQYGQVTEKGSPVKKPTGWMSNSKKVLEALSRRCSGRGGECSASPGQKHVICEGQVARRAAQYPFELCKAILSGFKEQLTEDGVLHIGVLGMQVDELKDTDLFEEEAAVMALKGEKVYRDAITGQILDPELVEAARRKELEYFISKQVWKKRPR